MAIYVARVHGITLPGTAARTIVQVVAGATKRVKIKEFGISFDGTDATKTPVLVDLIRQTSAGTTSSAVTLGLNDTVLEAAVATAIQNPTGGEPTDAGTGAIFLRSYYVSPAAGLFVMQFPLGDEPVIPLSGRVGLRVTTAAGSGTPNCSAHIVFEE